MKKCMFCLLQFFINFAPNYNLLKDSTMQTYTIEMDNRNADAAAFMKYMMSLSFIRIVENVPNHNEKPRLYDPETGMEFNDETIETVEKAKQGKDIIHVGTIDNFKKMVEAL